MAVLLKHHDLGHVALSIVEHGLPDASQHSGVDGPKHGLPRAIAQVCKVVYQAKRSLIKVTSLCFMYLWHRSCVLAVVASCSTCRCTRT